MVTAQRQGHRNFTYGTIVDHTQEIIGGIGAPRGKGSNIAGAVAGADNCYHITFGVPESSVPVGICLAILGIDVLIGRDGIFGIRDGAFLIHKVAGPGFTREFRIKGATLVLLPVGQNFAGFADFQNTQRFVILVVLIDHQNVLAVLAVISGGFVYTLGGDRKVHIETAVRKIAGIVDLQVAVLTHCGGCPLIVEPIGAVDFYQAVVAQRQLFGQHQHTGIISIEGVYILGQQRVGGIGHGDQLGMTVLIVDVVTLLIHPIDLERGILEQNCLAALLVDLGDPQIHFDFLIQHRILLVAVGRDLHGILGIGHGGLGIGFVRGVNGHDKGFCLEHILGRGSFYNEVLPIGQALHPDGSGIIGENLCQLIFVGAARRNPAVTAAVLEVTGGSESVIVRSNLVSVDLIGFGNGLSLTAEIVLGMAFIIFRVDIGIQNRFDQVFAAAALGKLVLLGQVGNQVEGKTGPLQVDTIRTAGAGNVLGKFYVAFHHLILRFCQLIIPVQVVIGTVGRFVEILTFGLPIILKGNLFDVPAFVGIAGGNVVVVLVTQITFGVALIVAVIGFGAVQRLALADVRPLVPIHIVGVLACIIGGQRRRGSGRLLGFGIHIGIGAGQLVSAILHRDDHAGAALHDVILAQVQVAEGQPAVLDHGAGDQMVFGKHGQVVIHPLAGVVPDGGMPDRGAVGIGDLAVVHRAGHAIRVLDVLGSIQVIHRTVQPGVSMGLTAGHGIAIGITATNIAHSIQIHFTERDFPQRTVILHDAGYRGHGVRIFVGCGLGIVSVVDTACILILNLCCGFITGLVDGHGGLYPAGSQQLGAARITGGDVGAVMSIVQRDHAAVVGFCDFDVIPPLAQGCTCGSGMLHIRPIAVVTGRCTSFDDDELALVALGVVHLPAGIVFGSIVSTVGHRVGTILIANNGVLIVAAERNVLLGDGVPLVDFIECIPGNLLAGLAVHLFQIYLQAPLVIFHNVIVGTIGRYSDGLVAAKAAIEFLEAIRDLHFIVREADGCQFSTGGCNGCIHHSLSLVLQLRNGGVFGCFCRRIRFGLAAVGAFLTAERCGAGFADFIVHRPAHRAVTAIVLVVVIVGMAAGGDGLRTGGTHLPAAAVDAAAGLGRRDGDFCTIHLFADLQLLFVCIDREGQIEAAAGALSRGGPVGGIVFGVGHIRDIRTAAFRNFFTHNGNDLPGIPGRRVIDIGVIPVFAGIGSRSGLRSLFSQRLGRGSVGLSSQTVRVIGHDPKLHVIVVAVGRSFGAFTLQPIGGGRSSTVLFFQQVQRKLPQTAPDIHLVGIVVTGRVLPRLQLGYIGKIIGRAAVGLAIQAVAAAVSLHAVKPDQPGAALETDRGDLAGDKRRCGPGSIGAGTSIGCGFGCRFALAQFHLQGLAQFTAVWPVVDKLHREILLGFHIETRRTG